MLVQHRAQGSLAACDSWFNNPAAQASTNYAIGDGTDQFPDGTIHCYVDPDGPNSPYANGVVDKPDAVIQAIMARTGNVNLNWISESIEYAGLSGTPLTVAQMASGIWLSAWRLSARGLAVDRNHVVGHYEIDSVNRIDCPELTAAEWSTLMEGIAAMVNPAPGDPCAEERAALASINIRANVVLPHMQAIIADSNGWQLGAARRVAAAPPTAEEVARVAAAHNNEAGPKSY